MALFVAAKFSEEEMPKIFDPGVMQDLKPQEFVVVPREGTEDIAFISGLEHKSVHQLKLRRDPYPRIIRRATEAEVESWWQRKAEERRALVIAKEKARELKLDIKMSHVRYSTKEQKAVFHFTSDQRIDFRALVKELSAILKMRIELWQIGVRDEARMVDGFGVCGLQTCCSTWLTDFRPITIRMAKDQDINLPPTKLSGQCGRLLCCLSYEVDQYRQMAKSALPKGSTTTYKGVKVVIIDRNIVANTYTVSEENGVQHTVKGTELGEDAVSEADVLVPPQMKRFGKKLFQEGRAALESVAEEPGTLPEEKPREPRKIEKPGKDPRKRNKDRLKKARKEGIAEVDALEMGVSDSDGEKPRKSGSRGKKRKKGPRSGGPKAETGQQGRDVASQGGAGTDAPKSGRRKKKRRKNR